MSRGNPARRTATARRSGASTELSSSLQPAPRKPNRRWHSSTRALTRVSRSSSNTRPSGADPNASGIGSAHGRVEGYLHEKAVPYVVVRPTQFMQNLLRWAPSIARAGALVVPLVDETVRVNLVDVRDVVEVEVAALTHTGHVGHTYIAAGPELLTYAEIAERLSDGVGSPIPLRVVPAERYREEAFEAGYPTAPVNRLVAYFSTLRTGRTALAVKGGDVKTVTGHPPRSIEQFARDNAIGLYEPRSEAVSWMG